MYKLLLYPKIAFKCHKSPLTQKILYSCELIAHIKLLIKIIFLLKSVSFRTNGPIQAVNENRKNKLKIN